MLLVWMKSGAIIMMLASCVFTSKQPAIQGSANPDSVIIADSRQRVTINRNEPSQQVQMITNKSFPYSGNQRFSLLMNEMRIFELPEGVYEVYLLKEKGNSATLTPKDSAFVSVLDTYALTEKNEKRNLYLDASKNVSAIVKNNTLPKIFYVIVLFRGNVLPNKSEAMNAGNLTIKSIQMIRIE